MLKAILLLQDGAGPHARHDLSSCCRKLHTAATEADARRLAAAVETIVIACPQARLQYWLHMLRDHQAAPVVWLCPDASEPAPGESEAPPDGILFPTMDTAQITVSLRLAKQMFRQRQKWNTEREQLLQRIEERKWIERAKAVLCQSKGLTEAEAYDFLRKQAMNERKRIGELAASIVKVYQLING